MNNMGNDNMDMNNNMGNDNMDMNNNMGNDSMDTNNNLSNKNPRPILKIGNNNLCNNLNNKNMMSFYKTYEFF